VGQASTRSGDTEAEETSTAEPQIALLGGESILLKVNASRVHLEPEAVVSDHGTFFVTNFRYHSPLNSSTSFTSPLTWNKSVDYFLFLILLGHSWSLH
jgi:hypothetical protein